MLKITTFNEFKIEYRNKTIYAADFKSEMVFKLFVYYICHRNAVIEVDDLIRELWPNGESINPSGALKNLTYRLRVFLKEEFPEDEFIVSKRGMYRFNPDIECVVDFEEFSVLITKFKFQENVSEQGLYRIIEIYQGEFFKEIKNLHFVLLQRAYYRSEYIKYAKQLCEKLFFAQRYAELNDICKKIVLIDRLEEQIYYYLILSCAFTGNELMGLEIYEKSVAMLKKEFGVTSVPLLNEAYNMLMKMKKNGERGSISDVKKSLLEKREPGPLFCEFETFKDIFQFVIRQRGLKNKSGVLMLCTIEFSFDSYVGKMERFKAEKIVKAYKDCICSIIRTGDMIAKYSEYQYIVYLGSATINNCTDITNRIDERFYLTNPQYKNERIVYNTDRVELIV